MNKIVLIILGMLIVTYLPRLIPFAIISNIKVPKLLDRFLKTIPYTALGALIIPGAFSSIPDNPTAAYLGIGFAVLYTWFRGGIIVPVVGSVVVVIISLTLGIG